MEAFPLLDFIGKVVGYCLKGVGFYSDVIALKKTVFFLKLGLTRTTLDNHQIYSNIWFLHQCSAWFQNTFEYNGVPYPIAMEGLKDIRLWQDN